MYVGSCISPHILYSTGFTSGEFGGQTSGPIKFVFKLKQLFNIANTFRSAAFNRQYKYTNTHVNPAMYNLVSAHQHV